MEKEEAGVILATGKFSAVWRGRATLKTQLGEGKDADGHWSPQKLEGFNSD